ncbi:nucleotidyltransferase domain-containing protein [Microbispora bryophytorum]|uniref:nucleotidyltransferase domain-containing protein n=1 Tax=Microbispora bryophytorum TaxID=1460882 RepID=UPI003721DBCC
MDAEAVCGIYDYLAERGVRIWIDGGWCVDALLGRQTRQHPDLDVAVDHKDEVEFAALMQGLGDKDREDVHALGEKFGFEIPPSRR